MYKTKMEWWKENSKSMWKEIAKYNKNYFIEIKKYLKWLYNSDFDKDLKMIFDDNITNIIDNKKFKSKLMNV